LIDEACSIMLLSYSIDAFNINNSLRKSSDDPSRISGLDRRELMNHDDNIDYVNEAICSHLSKSIKIDCARAGLDNLMSEAVK